MRVLFLDVDGVLAPFSSINRSRADALQANLVRRCGEFVEQSNCVVCLSSTWRHEVGVGATVELLRRHWPSAPRRIQSSTPVLHATRGQEIAAWLREVDDVEAFVILDDARDMAPVADRHVVIDSYVGIQPADLRKAAAILQRQRNVLPER